MSRYKCFAVAAVALLPLSLSLSLSCGKSGGKNPAAPEQHGSIEIRARVVNPPLSKTADGAGTLATTAEKLIVEIDGGAVPARFERKLDFSRPTLTDTLARIPPGKNRSITIWAVDKNDNVTHIDTQAIWTADIENLTVTSISTTLIPAAGSIYLQFIGLSNDYKSVYAAFSKLDGTLVAENSINRGARMFMSLDNIPHLTEGELTVLVIDNIGDTAFTASEKLTFNARTDNSVDLKFNENGGQMSIGLNIRSPGVTSGSYNFASKESLVSETGELIITELMWGAGNDNYIELHNPSDAAVSISDLVIEIDGTNGAYTKHNVAAAEIKARGYYVIGRQARDHVNAVNTISLGATGNWITVKRGGTGDVLDRVICTGTNANAAIEWPSVASSSRQSVELSKDKYNAQDNNFGKNWSAAKELVSGMDPEMRGTPGY